MDSIEEENCQKKIFRFLNIEGLRKTLGFIGNSIPAQSIDMAPLFTLKSLEYYRNIEGSGKDPCENKIVIPHPHTGQLLTYANCNPILVSCWSHCGKENLYDGEFWRVFGNDKVAVIESTVEDVNKLIKSFVTTPAEKNEHPIGVGHIYGAGIHHEEVKYYQTTDYHLLQNLKDCTPAFHKRKELYSKELEYRFAVNCNISADWSPWEYNIRLKNINSSTPNYIKKIYLNGNLSWEEGGLKEEFTRIKAYYSDAAEIIEVDIYQEIKS